MDFSKLLLGFVKFSSGGKLWMNDSMNRQQIAKNWVQPVTHPFGWPYCDHHGKTGPRDIYFLPTFHLITLFDKHKFSSYFLWYLFWQYLCSTNRRGKSGLPLLIQYLCWKNGNGISSSFFNTCARQTEEALSAAVTGSRPIISFAERERPLLPNPSTHLTPTYSFWYPFLVAFNHATNLSNFTPLTNFNQLNISEFFIIQLLFPNESYPLDSLFCSWLPEQPTGSDFFMDLLAAGFPRQGKPDVNLGKYHLLCNNLLIHRD